ncbi:MAG: 4Fe-4S dicluster domain-containing protein [Candidatus Brockarchaeota archaeon]|nr:4Fe-4S dicluster domain-containing protein [Candidatus Brockarchaeota archaeon]
MSRAEEELRNIAVRLLEKKEVELVVGYEYHGGSVRPCFVSKPEEADRLVWNPDCWFNLARCLRSLRGRRVGIVAKGCDGKTIVELLKENQLDRGSIVVIAVECDGVFKPFKYGSTRVERRLADYCKRCVTRVSPIADYVVKSDGQASPAENPVADDASDWLSLFRKCLKCMACVKACPLCYCTECSIEGFKPDLVHRLRVPQELFTFHLTRALHMAGRCVECGACESACPVEIPLTRLYHELNEWFRENYGYAPGRSVDEAPPPLVFKEGVEG